MGRVNELKQLHDAAPYIKCGYTLQVLLSQAYDMTYGLFDYDANPNRPLAAVSVLPSEDLSYRSARQLRLKQYTANRVLELTGINWLDFLSCPRDMVEEILSECGYKSREMLQEAEQAANTAEQRSARLANKIALRNRAEHARTNKNK